MLQRAASNAYSWWWASHIRTKQSKWLETNLQGMCIHNIDMLLLKLITFFFTISLLINRMRSCDYLHVNNNFNQTNIVKELG